MAGDETHRDQDPLKRRRATLLGSVVVAGLLAAAGTLAFLQRPPAPTATSAPRATGPSSAPHPPGPTPIPRQPVSGSGFSVADDPAAHQLVVFGGIDSYDTTWLWDGARWSLAHPEVSPPGRFGAAMAYDPIARVVMLYGGRLGPGDVVDDTWAWDGRTWRELDGGTGNPPRGELSAMAWDSTVNEMLLVSGGSAGQTWRWKATQWVRQISGDPPGGSFVSGTAADPISGNLVAVTCCGPGQADTATLRWTGTAWDRVSTGVAPATAFGLALDPTSHQLLLCSEDPTVPSGTVMWRWTGKVWSPVPNASPPIAPDAEVTDVLAGHVLVLGSLIPAVQGAPQPVHIWSWGGSAWTQVG